MTIRYLRSDSLIPKGELAVKTLEQIHREFGAKVEPFTLHLPLPELLAGAWMACRESLLAGSVRRDAKEAVAATVSAINRCPYCVDAHSIMILGSSGKDYTEALTAMRLEAIDDPYIQDVVKWSAATLSPGSTELLSPPFSAREAPEFIGTAVFFHYINRMASILLGVSPLPFHRGKLKKVTLRAAAWFFSKAIRLPKKACVSLSLLPEARLPEDFVWAKPSVCIAGAYAAFSRVIESAGTMVLPEHVRVSVLHAVETWDGKNPGTNRAWAKPYLVGKEENAKAACELALLAALAPYRVTDAEVSAFSDHYPGDEKLVAVLAWASFTAARRIGRWIAQTERPSCFQDSQRCKRRERSSGDSGLLI